jgi:hypothetical protein
MRAPQVAEHDLGGPIDVGVAAPPALVRERAVVADAGDGEPVADRLQAQVRS